MIEKFTYHTSTKEITVYGRQDPKLQAERNSLNFLGLDPAGPYSCVIQTMTAETVLRSVTSTCEYPAGMYFRSFSGIRAQLEQCDPVILNEAPVNISLQELFRTAYEVRRIRELNNPSDGIEFLAGSPEEAENLRRMFAAMFVRYQEEKIRLPEMKERPLVTQAVIDRVFSVDEPTDRKESLRRHAEKLRANMVYQGKTVEQVDDWLAKMGFE